MACRFRVFRVLCILALCIACWSATAVAVQPASVFTDHVVLQRDKPAPVWGTAKPAAKITVEFAGQTKTATADDRGRWLVRLEPLAAGSEPRTLTIRDKAETVTLSDVLVGDVWIAGGQSNMGRNVRASCVPDDFQMEFPLIRFLHVCSPGAPYPEDQLQPSIWERKDPSSADNAWNVCVGDVGRDCTAIGFFFAQRVFEETGVPQGLLWNAVAGSVAKEWIPQSGWRLEPELAETADEVDRWYPSTEIGLAAHRQAVEEISAWTKLARSAVTQGDPFPYPQPLLPAPPDPLGNRRGVTFLYNGRVHPLVPYAIKGILWYQGESDYANVRYLHEMEALVVAWRTRFASPGEQPTDLPFYFVQMQRCGSYMSPDVRDRQYLSYFTIPNAGMAVLLDLDVNLHPRNKYDAGRRMALWALAKDYGKDVVYSGPIYKSHRTEGDKVIVTFDFTCGRLFIGQKDLLQPVEKLPDAKLTNVEITADGRNWLPAQSRLDGDQLVVWADGVENPQHVRYCWNSIAQGPFLYNARSLPAGQFNTYTLTELFEKEGKQ